MSDFNDPNEEQFTFEEQTKETKAELKKENATLKQALINANTKIRDYEEIISKDNIKDLGYSNLTKDDLFNIMHNSTFIIDTE